MMKNVAHKVVAVGMLVGLLSLSVSAELGLAQILSAEGNKAVGLAVKTAAEGVYSVSTDPETAQGQLTDLINEAVATGDAQAVRYAIVAVLLAGGRENLETGKAAIDSSDALAQFPDLTASTVAAVVEMLGSADDDAASGGDNGGDNGGGDSGGEDMGGGDVFDDLFAPDITDFDVVPTRI